jgi:endonuclease/exonuclease/phosphatase family metal-dependent hydrolase
MTIKLLQWNVWYKEDPQKIANKIKQLDPDVICGQEFIQIFKGKNAKDTAKIVADKLGYNYVYEKGDSWSNNTEKDTQGNAIFSKFPIVDSKYSYLQQPKHNPRSGKEEGRVYLEAIVQLGNKKISIGTTHLSYSHKFEFDEIRKSELDHLIKILETKRGDYIFTGDLNATPESPVINSIKNILKNAGPKNNQNTWTTKPFDYHGFKETKLNWRLDYIFATNDVKIMSSEIIKTDLSDHLPILATIEI